MEYQEYENRNQNARKQSPIVIVLIIIIILLIIALLFLGFYSYNLKVEIETLKSQKDNTDVLDDEEIYFGGSNQNTEIGAQLDKTDDIAQNLIEKIDFPTHAIASIYAAESFNISTIPNDLVLRLGWAKSEKELVKNNTDNLGKYKQKVALQEFEESVLGIFGTRVNYIDNSFTNINVPTFHNYYENRGAITFNGDTYIADYTENNGNKSAFIHQEIDKILKYNSRIEIYVKTAFIDVQNSQIKIYKGFENDKFDGKVLEVDSVQFNNAYANAQSDSSFESNSKILEISDQLNTYVYTFTIDSNNGEYYLSSFNQAK